MYGYKGWFTGWTIFKNPQRQKEWKMKTVVEKSDSGKRGTVNKCCVLLGLRQHGIFLLMVSDAVISEQQLGRLTSIHINVIIERFGMVGIQQISCGKFCTPGWNAATNVG